MDNFGTRFACLFVLVIEVFQIVTYLVATVLLLVCGIDEGSLFVDDVCWNETSAQSEPCVVIQHSYAVTASMVPFCLMILAALGMVLPMVVTCQMICTLPREPAHTDTDEFRAGQRVEIVACASASGMKLLLALFVSAVLVPAWSMHLKWGVFVQRAEGVRTMWFLNTAVYLPFCVVLCLISACLLLAKCNFSEFWKKRGGYFTYRDNGNFAYRGLSTTDEDEMKKADLDRIKIADD